MSTVYQTWIFRHERQPCRQVTAEKPFINGFHLCHNVAKCCFKGNKTVDSVIYTKWWMFVPRCAGLQLERFVIALSVELRNLHHPSNLDRHHRIVHLIWTHTQIQVWRMGGEERQHGLWYKNGAVCVRKRHTHTEMMGKFAKYHIILAELTKHGRLKQAVYTHSRWRPWFLSVALTSSPALWLGAALRSPGDSGPVGPVSASVAQQLDWSLPELHHSAFPLLEMAK